MILSLASSSRLDMSRNNNEEEVRKMEKSHSNMHNVGLDTSFYSPESLFSCFAITFVCFPCNNYSTLVHSETGKYFIID